MTQLMLSAEPRLLARLKQRLRAAGRLDLVHFGVTLWLALWASCVGASLVLLTSG